MRYQVELSHVKWKICLPCFVKPVTILKCIKDILNLKG